jgi:hypothetical protein
MSCQAATIAARSPAGVAASAVSSRPSVGGSSRQSRSATWPRGVIAGSRSPKRSISSRVVGSGAANRAGGAPGSRVTGA